MPLAPRFSALLLLAALRMQAAAPPPCASYESLDLGNGFSLDLPGTVCAERTLSPTAEFFRLRTKAEPDTLLLGFYAELAGPSHGTLKPPPSPQDDDREPAETRTLLPFTIEFAGELCRPIFHRAFVEEGATPGARLDGTVDCELEDGSRTTILLHFWYEGLAPAAQKNAEAILASLRATRNRRPERDPAEDNDSSDTPGLPPHRIPL